MNNQISITVGDLLKQTAQKYPNDVAVKYTDRRQLVGDTDNGNKMKERIAELKELIRAYREGELKEKER